MPLSNERKRGERVRIKYNMGEDERGKTETTRL
jgi:hypothetical protein